jgi:hypothetical protein
MFERLLLLRLSVSLTIAMATFTGAAQDTPIGSAAKAPVSAAKPAAKTRLL